MKQENLLFSVFRGKCRLMWHWNLVRRCIGKRCAVERRMLISELMASCDRSKRTVCRWLRGLVKEGFLFIDSVKGKKLARIKGRGSLLKEREIKRNYNRCQIRIDSFSNFKTDIIRATHLNLQRSYRYNSKKIMAQGPYLEKSGEIDQAIDKYCKIGCAYIKVSEFLGISYGSVASALKGFVRKTYAVIGEYSQKEFKATYNKAFFKQNPRYSFLLLKHKYIVRYILPSIQ